MVGCDTKKIRSVYSSMEIALQSFLLCFNSSNSYWHFAVSYKISYVVTMRLILVVSMVLNLIILYSCMIFELSNQLFHSSRVARQDNSMINLLSIWYLRLMIKFITLAWLNCGSINVCTKILSGVNGLA